eukprot:NODE_4914_length_1831_cov_4.988850.p13 GENE.NODE_4914_length_1831_cov_4.988850~~NODE_4914_length_1831_cov_4.988850.p13  ORF type:complete len:54 (+),score=14.19 NODE_4914_length_1831_cov_4.988850:799-960(+)
MPDTNFATVENASLPILLAAEWHSTPIMRLVSKPWAPPPPPPPPPPEPPDCSH